MTISVKYLTTIGFDDSIVSIEHAIEKHANHSSVIKIKDVYKRHEDRFSLSFNCVKQDGVRQKLSKSMSRKVPVMTKYVDGFYV